MRHTICSLLLLCASSIAVAQPAVQSPGFEPVSIKLSDPSSRGGQLTGGPGTSSPGQLIIQNIPLSNIILRAYDKRHPSEMVFSGPSPNERYDVTASVPPGITREQFLIMFQKLLADRFGLAVHKETRELPVYELTLPGDSSRFRPAARPSSAGQASQPGLSGSVLRDLPKDNDGWPIIPPDVTGRFSFTVLPYNRLMFRAQPFSELLDSVLAGIFDRAYVDKTGLTGIYDYDVDIRRPEATSGDPVSEMKANIIAAVERLGVKVVSANRPVEVVVIDKLNTQLTGN